MRDTGEVKQSTSPKELARELIESADPDWLRELVDALDREVRSAPLHRLTTLWDLSNAGAARLFGVSRQAFAKWLGGTPPADRADDIARVASITETLDRYVKRERIPAVVRRSSPMLQGRSIIDALEAGEHEETATSVRMMFDLRRVQP